MTDPKPMSSKFQIVTLTLYDFHKKTIRPTTMKINNVIMQDIWLILVKMTHVLYPLQIGMYQMKYRYRLFS